MTRRVAGKKALVFGGGTGIGLACAQALVKEGAAVFLSSRRETVVREAARQLCEHGSAGYASGDATEVADVQRVTTAAAEFMGGIDTLVISAGAGGRTPIFDTEPDEFQRIIDNTLRPIFLGVRYAAPHLLAAGKASVIVISSMYGLVGQRERVAYCGAKAGANGMVKSMALDFADRGVRVNAICPGFIETPLAIEVANLEPDPEAVLNAKRLMHPIARAGGLDEVGELAVYLASDLSAFMTGQAIALDGGYTVR
jgi:NAD(P)-dependent dehydrogenase (short-subunit alcohol dehydrogenase family)